MTSEFGEVNIQIHPKETILLVEKAILGLEQN